MPTLKKNAQRTIVFVMIDSADTTAVKTGLSVAAQISKDGGAFADASNAVAEIGSGFYTLTLTAAETNADAVAVKLTASGAVQQNLALYTDAKLVSDLADFDPATDDVSLSDTDLADLKDGIKGTPGGRTVKETYDEAATAKAVAAKLDTALEADGAVHRFTTNALEQAPTGAGWTADEREQIRQALGIVGNAAETTGEGNLDAVLARLRSLLAAPIVASTTVAAVNATISRYRGDTVPIAFDLGRDLTGAALAFTVKRRATDAQAAALIAKTSAEVTEIEITDAEAGLFEVKLAAGDTADLLPDGRRATFLYDVEMTLDGEVETVAAGDFVLVPDVTTA